VHAWYVRGFELFDVTAHLVRLVAVLSHQSLVFFNLVMLSLQPTCYVVLQPVCNVEFKVTLHEQSPLQGQVTVLKVTVTVCHTAEHRGEEYDD